MIRVMSPKDTRRIAGFTLFQVCIEPDINRTLVRILELV
jgi:hypothetical protein